LCLNTFLDTDGMLRVGERLTSKNIRLMSHIRVDNQKCS